MVKYVVKMIYKDLAKFEYDTEISLPNTINPTQFVRYLQELDNIYRPFYPICETKNPRRSMIYKDSFIGVTGFEPAASWSRTKHSTGLSHTPIA